MLKACRKAHAEEQEMLVGHEQTLLAVRLISESLLSTRRCRGVSPLLTLSR